MSQIRGLDRQPVSFAYAITLRPTSTAADIDVIQQRVCIGVNRPAFGGTVPHFHQMSREIRQMSRFLENGILFFPLPIILHFCLAMQQSDELRIKIGSKFARRQSTDLYTHCIIDQCDRRHLYFTRGSHRRRLFIFLTPAASTLLPSQIAYGKVFSVMF